MGNFFSSPFYSPQHGLLVAPLGTFPAAAFYFPPAPKTKGRQEMGGLIT